MAVKGKSRGGEATEAAIHALLSLHVHAGEVDPRALRVDGGDGAPIPAPLGVVEALTLVAQAPEEEIPASARLGALYSLARARLLDDPDAQAAAHTVAEAMTRQRGGGLVAADLLEDVRRAGADNRGLEETPNGQAMDHHEVAFVGRKLCTTRRVTVGDREAIAIFSEFETNAKFDHVASWIDPRTWSTWGPVFFKQMAPVLTADDLVALARPPGDEHWTGLFREEVRLPLRRIKTMLRCAYWKETDRAAGMTYDLEMSLDRQLDVDQGYLLVNNTGEINRVKVLKIVGFTNNVFDELALWVCPWWTDWVSHALKGGSSSQPLPPTGSIDRLTVAGSSCVDAFDGWMDFVTQSAHGYLDIVEDAASRARTSGYTMTDLMEHGRTYWSQLAKDWATAWSLGLGGVDTVSQDGVDADLSPSGLRRRAEARSSAAPAQPNQGAGTERPQSGQPRSAVPGGPNASAPAAGADAVAEAEPEAVTIPVKELGPQDRPVVSDLVSIGERVVTIPASRIVVSVVQLRDDVYAVRLRTTAPVAHGLYVGHVTGAGSDRRVPVQLYVERVTRT